MLFMQSLMVAVAVALGSAELPRVGLTYQAPAGCPDEAALKMNVVARLGYDPFSAQAPIRTATQIEKAPKGYRGALSLEQAGVAARRRAITSELEDCRDVFESLALALALAIDPQFATRPKVTPSPSVPASPVVEVKPPAPPPPAPTAKADLSAFVGPIGSVGLSIRPTIGGVAEIGFRYKAFGLSFEGRVDAPVSFTVPQGAVQTNVLLGTLAPCLRLNRLGICLTASIGALQVNGMLTFGLRQTNVVAAVGARVQYEFMFSRYFGFGVRAGVAALPIRITVLVDNVPVWVTGPVTADVAVGAIGLF